MTGRRLLAVVVAALVSGIAVLGGPPPARASFHPLVEQRYAIAATLDVATGRLDAVTEIELTNRSVWSMDHIDLSVVPRALGYLSMPEPITVDGAPVEAEWTTTISMRVPLGGLEPRATARITVPFTLSVDRSPEAYAARTSRENGVLSFGQWFPIVSTAHEVHGIGDPQISFTAERIRLDLTTTTELPREAVACPGLVAAPEARGTVWSCEADRVRDFSFVVNPRFRVTERQVGEVALRVHTETVSGELTADLAVEALEGMEEAFGFYPWPDLVLAEVGGSGGFSMEYPRMIHLTRSKVTDRYVVFHEVAHQWFYAQVGNDQQREPWLDEGFADFSARYLMGIAENQCSTRPVDSEVFAWSAGPVSGGDWTSCDGYFHAVFYRGTEFLSAVRAAMGDEDFFGAIRAWVDRYRHDVTTGARLLSHLSVRSDADLRPIFAAYLADPALRPSARPHLVPEPR